MTREEAKELLPIIQAFAEGKTIQFYSEENGWLDWLNFVNFNEPPSTYRIKPEPKYRPFKTMKECWDEMLKHEPVGWIKAKNRGTIMNISNIRDIEGEIRYAIASFGEIERYSAQQILNHFEFIDGEPFGIKEE